MVTEFHLVATIGELGANSQLHVALGGEEILLCRDQEHYYAISYYCSHAEFALEGGFIRNGCITCPYHGAEFSLEDGSVMAPPAFEAIKTYPIKVANGGISIATDAQAAP